MRTDRSSLASTTVPIMDSSCVHFVLPLVIHSLFCAFNLTILASNATLSSPCEILSFFLENKLSLRSSVSITWLIFEVSSRRVPFHPHRIIATVRTKYGPKDKSSFVLDDSPCFQRVRESLENDEEEDDAFIPRAEQKPTKKASKVVDENVPLVKAEGKTPKKKLKTQDVDSAEKKRRVENYKTFMNRGGADAPGSKTIPEGAPRCLKNLAFVISGKKSDALSKGTSLTVIISRHTRIVGTR